MKFKGIERDAKWVDENFMNFPPNLEDILVETVRNYYDKYHNSEYMSEDTYINMMHWMKVMDVVDEVNDELL